ncbi:MAG TPA: secondary thiamine-phosphate synthase enzyme YjbQ [Candidatus Dormibacteraeota bacterium]|jgi:secondary thiamine-phosphate synthase enzyme
MVKVRLRTSRREEALDVTEKVRRAVAESGIREGTCTVFAPHTTCAIAVNEGHDPAVIEDFLNHIRELVPREAGFEHAEGNSDSHIKALLVGPSATVPVSGGEVRLGQWQAIFMCEFDGPRERSLWVTVTGERGR